MWTTSVVILTLENLLIIFVLLSTSQHFSLNQLIFFHLSYF